MLANMFRSQIPMEYLRSLKRSDSSPSFNTNKKDESFTTTAANTQTSRDRKNLMESSSSPTIPNNQTQINHSRNNKSIDENNSQIRGQQAANNRSSVTNHSRKRSVGCSPLNTQLPPPTPQPPPPPLPPPPPPPPPPPSSSSSSANSRSIIPVNVNARNGPPIPYTKRLLKHQNSLNDEDNNSNKNHGMLSKSSSKASSTCSYQNQSSVCSGENDGPGLDESVANSNNYNNNNNNNNSWEIGNENCSNFVINSNNSASIASLYQKSTNHNHNNNNNNHSNTSSISNSRESNLNYGNNFPAQSIANNGPQHYPSGQQRPPAIRSLSSASSLSPTSSNNYNNNNNNNNYNQQSSTSPTKSIGGNPSFRQQRRGAMVSCENLLSENPELYGSSTENAFKNSKTRKIGTFGIFSNPFKSEPEKLEQLNELLQKYSENGIPNPKYAISNIATSNSTNKLNHLRASSLSISGLISGSSGIGLGAGGGMANGTVPANNNASSQLSTSLATAANNQGLLSTAKTSLSTTDLYRLNYSTIQNSNNSNGPLSTLATPQHQHHHQSQQQQPQHYAPSGQLLLSSASFDATVDSYYYLEPEWRSIVENADQLPPKVQSRNEAIWELLQTEVSYIRRLKVINDVFIACLLNLQNECLLTEIDPKCVFSNITEVYEANHDFWIHYLLPMLNNSREKKCPLDPTMMKDGFLKFDQIFRPYRQYCFDLSKCTQYLKEKYKTNNLFKTYIMWCESHKDCDRLGLSDFLAKPMQRITKYVLLLQAILKKTDDEVQRESLYRMEHCVKPFVNKLNISMREHQSLSEVVSRIESYDAIDCSNDEAEKFLKDYMFLDLMQAMPDCSPDKIRRLYKEDTLKLKDSTNKQDVHCFLFTDVFLVCKPLNKKSNDGRMKVIRQPFITDRLIVRELKDGLGFLLIYLNELKVASTYMLLFCADCRSWVETIKKAQNDYSNLKLVSINQQQQEFYANNAPMTTYHSYDDDYYGNAIDQNQLMFATSPRSSSRSSLVHSHSGSQDIGDQTHQSMLPYNNCNQLSIQQQSSRGISFELGDLRNPSLVVEDADALARSQSFDDRSPSVTITSPRHDRRAFLQRNQQQLQPQPQSEVKTITYEDSGNDSSKTNVDFGGHNSLSLNVPYIQPVQNVPVQASRQTRRSVPTISNMGGSHNNTISLNESNNNCLGNNTATIQVSVHPPPPSPSPPLPSPTSPAKRSPSKTTIISRPLPPLPPPPPSPTSVPVQQPTSPSTRSSPPTPPPAPPPPPSLMSISFRSAPGPMTMTINKPPLVKTKNVSYGVASMSYAQDKPSGHVMAVFESKDNAEVKEKNPINIHIGDSCLQNQPNETDTRFCDRNDHVDDVQQDFSEGDDSKNRCSLQPKRTYRPDRRYHTADSIEQLNKEKDNSIHKRLSWNYGQQQQQGLQQHHHHPQANHHPGCIHYGHNHHNNTNNNCSSINHNQSLLQPRSLVSSSSCSHHQNHLPNKCCSIESVCCSSGFSSTASVPLSVGSIGDNPLMVSGCCTCCCSDINQSRLQEEEEDLDEEDFKHNSCSATIRRNPSNSSDRDSALPVSPALNETGSMSPIGGYHHSHSNSQCSMDSCGGGGGGISDKIQTTIVPKPGTPKVSNCQPDSDFKIDVHEMKDGISSVKITLANNSNQVSMPSKSNLKKIRELLLSDCNLESSEV